MTPLYLDTCFENASPLLWDPMEDGGVAIHLIPDR